MVEPTNACNLHCTACPTGKGALSRPPRAMRFEEFKKILDECLDPAGYLHHVAFYNYGEPFLCADLLPMVRYAADRRLKTDLTTNGHFFKSERATADVVESRLSALTIALDGADEETLRRYRKGASFAEVTAGTRRMMEARRKAGSATPDVALQFIVMKHNEDQIERMRDLARDLGVDRLVLKTVCVKPTDPDFQRLASELVPNDPGTSRYVRLADGRYALKGVSPRRCTFVYTTMVVNSNGEVVPCSFDAHAGYVIGNVLNQSVAEVWKGKRFSEFRKRVLTDRTSIAACRDCPDGRVKLVLSDERLRRSRL
jgi:radical SAM protein with 4Fe4S-binding SPASM domain